MRSFKIKCKLPSSKVISVRELNNGIYYDLQKYILDDDYEGFFQILDEFISLDVKDFMTYNIIDKYYCYITLYAYSVRNTIIEGNPMLKIPEITLDTILENITKTYSEDKWILIHNNNYCLITIPTTLSLIDTNFTYNILSSIKKVKINGEEYNVDNKDLLISILDIDDIKKITEFIDINFNKSIPFINDIKFPILSTYFPKFIVNNIYKDNLGNINDNKYIFMRHLRVSPNEYDLMTPIESMYYIGKLIEEKESQNKEAETNNSEINIADL